MAVNNKSHKAFKIIGLILLFILLTAGVLSGLDYKSYKDGNRSYLFGTLSNYAQNQTLKFGNLDLKITNVSLDAYQKPTTTPCVPETKVTPHDPFGILGIVACDSLAQTYEQDLSQYQTKNKLTIDYSYSNVGSLSLNMSDYKIKLLSNTALSNNGQCINQPSGQMLKDGSEGSCISADISKMYHGPLALSVSSGSNDKDISVSLPK